jgi:hypothetical protein
MDGPGGIVVEFKESEAFALLLGAAMLRGISKLQPEMIDAMVVQLVPQLRAGAFVGPRQWRADVLVGGLKLWRALGLSDPPAL